MQIFVAYVVKNWNGSILAKLELSNNRPQRAQERLFFMGVSTAMPWQNGGRAAEPAGTTPIVK